jgi:hypothetical protein
MYIITNYYVNSESIRNIGKVKNKKRKNEYRTKYGVRNIEK